MNFARLNNTSIDEAFEKFHRENPEIYALYKKFAMQWIERGAKKISSKQIVGRVRWFSAVETACKDYKINDAFTSRYARLFIKDFPSIRIYLKQEN